MGVPATHLIIRTPPQTIDEGDVSGPVEVCVVDANGNLQSVPAVTPLTITADPASGSVGPAPGTLEPGQTAVALLAGMSCTPVFFSSRVVGNLTLVVHPPANSGWTEVRQNETIAVKILVVNNHGQIDKTKVDIATWKDEQGIFSVSPDGVAVLVLDSATRAVAADGSRVTLVTVDRIQSPPPPPPGYVIPVALKLGPNGATFNPPLLLRIDYTKVTLPPETDVSKLRIHVLTGDRWEPIDSTVDQAKGTVSTTITHFSDYAIIAPVRGTNWLPFGLGGFGLFGIGIFGLLLLGYSRRWSVVAVPVDTPPALSSRPGGIQEAGAAADAPREFRIETRNARGRPFKPGADLIVRLTTSSSSGRLDAAADGPFAGRELTVVLPSETGEQTFYYRDTARGRIVFRARTRYRLTKWVRSRWPANSETSIDLGEGRGSN